MLIRPNTFVEWVTVYYDSNKLSEEQLYELIRKRCPESKNPRVENETFTAMNPIVANGDLLQLQIANPEVTPITNLTLPAGWKIVGEANGVVIKDKKTYLSILIPKKTERKNYTIKLSGKDKTVHETAVEVVRRVH